MVSKSQLAAPSSLQSGVFGVAMACYRFKSLFNKKGGRNCRDDKSLKPLIKCNRKHIFDIIPEKTHLKKQSVYTTKRKHDLAGFIYTELYYSTLYFSTGSSKVISLHNSMIFFLYS